MSPTPSRSAARVMPVLAGRAAVVAQRARLTVVPRLRSRAPRVPFLVLVTVVLLGGIVGLLLFNTSMQQAAFTATTMEKQADDLQARQEALAMQLDQLRDPQRIATQACANGMVMGPVAGFLDVDTGKITGSPTPAVKSPCGLTQPPVQPPPAVGAPAGTTAPNANPNPNANSNSNANPNANPNDTGRAAPTAQAQPWGAR